MDVNVCGMRYGHAGPPPSKGKTTAKKDATRPLARAHLKSSHTHKKFTHTHIPSPMYIHTSCTYALVDRIMVPKVHNIVNRKLSCASAVYKCGSVCGPHFVVRGKMDTWTAEQRFRCCEPSVRLNTPLPSSFYTTLEPYT